MRTKRSGDIAAGIFLNLIGLVTFWASWQIAEGAGGQLHPRTFPLILGTLLFCGGSILAISSYRSSRGKDQKIEWPDYQGWKYWVMGLVSMAAYIGLLPIIGFIIGTFFFVAFFTWYFGKYKPIYIAIYALGTAFFVYLLFVRLLQLTLPLGPFSFL